MPKMNQLALSKARKEMNIRNFYFTRGYGLAVLRSQNERKVPYLLAIN